MNSVTFPKSSQFWQTLEEQVDEYFRSRHLSRRGHPALYAKAVVMVVWAAASYVFLVYLAGSFWTAAAGASSLALAVVGVGFNIQHDANHGAFSRHQWINRVAAWSLDLIGASSYFWRMKHNVFHHTYTNIVDRDDDVSLWPFGRADRDEPHFWFHRYQHVYIWALYAFIHARYVVVDLYRLVRPVVGRNAVAYPKPRELAELLAGKVAFATLAFVLPTLVHPWWMVLAGFAAVSLSVGLIFGIVFQMAHLVDIVEHPGRVTGRNAYEFAIHQIRTTANFGPRNRFLTFFLGGLTRQREHHLFARVCHVHYPAIERIVRRVCEEHGIPCHENPTLIAALRSHYRFLKVLGQGAEGLQ
jgi:linoleoyl-CoA desaturase